VFSWDHLKPSVKKVEWLPVNIDSYAGVEALHELDQGHLMRQQGIARVRSNRTASVRGEEITQNGEPQDGD